MSNYMVGRAKTNNVLDVKNVIELTFGKKKRINIIASNTGLNYGLIKVNRYFLVNCWISIGYRKSILGSNDDK